jgi:hypothetical protein
MRHTSRPAVEREEGPSRESTATVTVSTVRMDRWVWQPEDGRRPSPGDSSASCAAPLGIRLPASTPPGWHAGSDGHRRPAGVGARGKGTSEATVGLARIGQAGPSNRCRYATEPRRGATTDGPLPSVDRRAARGAQHRLRTGIRRGIAGRERRRDVPLRARPDQKMAWARSHDLCEHHRTVSRQGRRGRDGHGRQLPIARSGSG